MALDKLTKIDGGGISTTSNYRVGIITGTIFKKSDISIDDVLFIHYAGF